MKKFFEEFRTFIAKGNVMDLAVGMIIGSTFTKIVNSIVNDIINPFVSLLTGRTNFEDMFVLLSEHFDEVTGEALVFNTLEEAKAAGATVIAYGNLIQVILDFLITAIAVFLIVKGLNKMRETGEKLRKKEAKEEAAEEKAE